MSISDLIYHPVSGRINHLLLFVVALFPAVVFFPFPASVFSNGIDPPLAWVFNFLIQGQLSLGKHIIFPHGPLAFLMYPLPVGANLWIAVSVHLIARWFMAYSLLKLATRKPIGYLFLALGISFLLLAVNDLLLTIILIIILCYLNFFERRNITWLIPALIITALALYIKAFAGIVSIILTLSFAGIMVYRVITGLESSYRLLLLLIVPLVLVVAWLGMYGELKGLLGYLEGMSALAADNSAAAAVYPENNWWLITTGIAGGLSLIVLNYKNIAIVRYSILIGPALFAIWKYGMAREDYLHATMMFLFILFIVLVFNIIAGKFRWLNVVISVIVVLMFYFSMQNAYYYEPLRINASGLQTLVSKVIHNQYFADTSNLASTKLISRNKLDNRIIQLIGKQKADIYPWDYSYIAANHFNWQPRPVLQSYASYTRELDQLNARHFQSPDAPEFIVWELRKITRDIHGGTLESIDGRYLLNDEPDTFKELLKRYELVDTQEGVFPVLLLKRKQKPYEHLEKSISKTSGAWNTWVNVPDVANEILQASVSLERNLAGSMKSFFYKDEAVFVYYQLTNDEIRMYRIVPKNAAYGLWINPLIRNPEKGKNSLPVKKIMFRCSNTAMMKDEINIEWKRISFINTDRKETNPLFAFLGITPDSLPVQILSSNNNLEEKASNWSVPDESKVVLTGQNLVYQLFPDAYSITYECPLDSLLTRDTTDELMIRTGVWAKSTTGAKAVYVISIEKDGESLLWQAVDIQNFIHETSGMNYVTNFTLLDHEMLRKSGLVLKVYAWNTGEKLIQLDDFSVRIETW